MGRPKRPRSLSPGLSRQSRGKSLLPLLVVVAMAVGAFYLLRPMTFGADAEIRHPAPERSGTLVLRVGAGDITLRGGSGGEVVVRARFSGRANAPAEKVSQAKLAWQNVPGQMILQVQPPPGLRADQLRVDLDVELPARTPVEADTTQGRISIESMAAKVRARAADGSIDVRDGRGELDLTAGGAVSVVCRHEAATANNIRVFSSGGDIDVRLPGQLSAAVEILAPADRVQTGLPLKPRPFTNCLQGTLGSGRGLIHLEAAKGVVRLR